METYVYPSHGKNAQMNTLQQKLYVICMRHNRMYRLIELGAPEEVIQRERYLVKKAIVEYAQEFGLFEMTR